MSALHLTKVAFGCSGLDVLIERMASRQEAGEVRLTTRYCPKRLEELQGGSLFWIIRHQLVARSPIIAFEPDEATKRWSIVIDPALMIVQPYPRRAHQGWRYLDASAAPADIGPASAMDGDSLPGALMQELADIGLF